MSDVEILSSKKRKLSPDVAHEEEDEGGPSSSAFNNDSSSPSSSTQHHATSSSSPNTTTPNKLPPRPPNTYDNIRTAIVINDGTRTNLIRLIGLKSLFARQLPKMPKEYIARLVFDRRHKSLAILSSDPEKKDCDDEIIGGICYRAYPEMRFAEIAFCA
eukprot:scaffold13054_cov134-Skeletonema_marinoi.AAC.3